MRGGEALLVSIPVPARDSAVRRSIRGSQSWSLELHSGAIFGSEIPKRMRVPEMGLSDSRHDHFRMTLWLCLASVGCPVGRRVFLIIGSRQSI